MYSRSYNDIGGELNLPESYGGVALQGGFVKEHTDTEEKGEVLNEDVKKDDKAEPTFLGGVLGGLLHKSGISRLGEKIPFLDKIGSEEILIILAALFLFLSKDGDKECAAALILLLFIS